MTGIWRFDWVDLTGTVPGNANTMGHVMIFDRAPEEVSSVIRINVGEKNCNFLSSTLEPPVVVSVDDGDGDGKVAVRS